MGDDLKSRIQAAAESRPEFQPYRSSIVVLRAMQEQLQDRYLEVENAIDDLQQELDKAARTWCEENPKVAP